MKNILLIFAVIICSNNNRIYAQATSGGKPKVDSSNIGNSHNKDESKSKVDSSNIGNSHNKDEGKPKVDSSNLYEKVNKTVSDATNFGKKEVEGKQIKRMVKHKARKTAKSSAKNAPKGTHWMVKRYVRRAIKEAARQELYTDKVFYSAKYSNDLINIIDSVKVMDSVTKKDTFIKYSISTYQKISITKSDTFFNIPITINYSRLNDSVPVDIILKKINTIKLKLYYGNLPDSPKIDTTLTFTLDTTNSTNFTTIVYAALKCKKINFDTLGDLYKYSGRIYIGNNGANFISLGLSYSKIAPSRLQIFAAAYATPTTVRADDPKLTQTYVRFNIPIKELNGIDNDASFSKRCIFFRNIFTQFTYTTNANNANYIDSISYKTNNLDQSRHNNIYNWAPLDSPGAGRHVNRLDLLESANLNLNITLPVLTYVIPQFKHYRGDFAHLYLEPFCSLLSTNVSRAIDTTNTTVYSLQPGFDIGMRTEHMLFDKVPLFVEFSAKMFWIVPLSNSIAPDLNYQYAKIGDYNVMDPRKHLIDPSNHPYYNFDALILYNTNKDDPDGSSNVFLHFSFLTNIVSPTTSTRGHVFNNFMQFQVGYGLNISTFISQVQKKATPSTSTTNTNQ